MKDLDKAMIKGRNITLIKRRTASVAMLCILIGISGIHNSFAQTPALQAKNGDEKGFEAFKKNVHPLLLKHCASCHSEQGKGPAHSVEDARQSYDAIRNYIPNFINLESSKFVTAATSPEMAGDTLTPAELTQALQNWWNEGENTTFQLNFLAGKKILTPQKIPTLPQDGSFKTMTWDLGEIDSDLKRVQFKVDIQSYAQAKEGSAGTYRLKNPRISFENDMNIVDNSDRMVEVEGVHIIINGILDSRANTYASVKAKVPPQIPFDSSADPSNEILSRSYQIVLGQRTPQKNAKTGAKTIAKTIERSDEMSFAFSKLQHSLVPISLAHPNSVPKKVTKGDLKPALGSVFDEKTVGKAARFVTLNASPEHPIEFEMGSPRGVANPYTSEDLHRVRLTKGFEFQATELTQLQWYLVMPKPEDPTPSMFTHKSQCDEGSYPTQQELDAGMPPMCKHHPVESVSWVDICGRINLELGEKCGDQDGFIKRINTLQSDYTYNLPTEAQWEYMAHAGLPAEYAYGWGNDFDGQYAWYTGNSAEGSVEPRTHAVATRLPTASPQNNADEIYDLAGNVWEWVLDRHESYIHDVSGNYSLWPWIQEYKAGAYLAIDPQDTNLDNRRTFRERVRRGGGWDNNKPYNFRSATRGIHWPKDPNPAVGFRLVRRLR